MTLHEFLRLGVAAVLYLLAFGVAIDLLTWGLP